MTLSSSVSDQYKSTEYLSTSNFIYLELISSPSLFINEYDDDIHPNQFQFFFNSLIQKSKSGICPYKYSFDCRDSYCVHENSRCNGIDECRTKLDENLCQNQRSISLSIYSQSFYYLFHLRFNTWAKFILIMTSTWLIKFTSTMKCVEFTATNIGKTTEWNNLVHGNGCCSD